MNILFNIFQLNLVDINFVYYSIINLYKAKLLIQMFILHYHQYRKQLHHHLLFVFNKLFRIIFQKLVMIFVYKVNNTFLSISIIWFLFSIIVNTDNPSISSIQGQISCNGMSVPHKIERTKDLHVWHLKFRPYVPGTYKVHLTHNGLSLISKKKKKLFN